MRKIKFSKINLKDINDKLHDYADIIQKKVYVDNHVEAFFFYIGNLTNKDLVQRDFINPLVAMDLVELSNEVNLYNIPCTEIALLYEAEAIVDSVMGGYAVFVCEQLPHAVSVKLTGIVARSIEEPIIEKNVRGPHEGFIEPLGTNLALLRRKIKNNRLKFRSVTLGVQTKQKVGM